MAFEISTEVACAHFLFAHVIRGSQPRVELHFAESAWDFSANDRMVSLMGSARSWHADGQTLEFESKPHAMVCPMESDQKIACSEFTYGLMSRGETFLLRYHAKGVDGIEAAETNGGLHAEIVATPSEDGQLIVTVLSKGTPFPGAEIIVPTSGMNTEEMTTDENGQIRINTPTTSLYSFRAMVPEERSGTHDGKPYELVRHYTTLTVHDHENIPEGSDGLAWAILQDAQHCNAATVGGSWNANFRMTDASGTLQGKLMHDGQSARITEPEEASDRTIQTIGSIRTIHPANDIAIGFEDARTAAAGCRIVIPEHGMTYVIKDRVVETIIESSDDGSRRIDVTGRTRLEDGRILPERLVITEFDSNGTIESVTLTSENYVDQNGDHVLKSVSHNHINGPGKSDQTVIRLSDVRQQDSTSSR
ncbi:MAG: hypothetical protein CMJ40_09755 [Phycisphaerae bacterium]|nr:hypothetical protein [Phycisphaerae bacterium]